MQAAKMLPTLLSAGFLVLMAASCTDSNPSDTALDRLHNSGRVQVEQIGVFDDDLAFGGKRAIYIIRDTKTEREFIGVSGIGISELGSHSSGKSSISDER